MIKILSLRLSILIANGFLILNHLVFIYLFERLDEAEDVRTVYKKVALSSKIGRFNW